MKLRELDKLLEQDPEYVKAYRKRDWGLIIGDIVERTYIKVQVALLKVLRKEHGN